MEETKQSFLFQTECLYTRQRDKDKDGHNNSICDHHKQNIKRYSSMRSRPYPSSWHTLCYPFIVRMSKTKRGNWSRKQPIRTQRHLGQHSSNRRLSTALAAILTLSSSLCFIFIAIEQQSIHDNIERMKSDNIVGCVSVENEARHDPLIETTRVWRYHSVHSNQIYCMQNTNYIHSIYVCISKQGGGTSAPVIYGLQVPQHNKLDCVSRIEHSSSFYCKTQFHQ